MIKYYNFKVCKVLSDDLKFLVFCRKKYILICALKTIKTIPINYINLFIKY